VLAAASGEEPPDPLLESSVGCRLEASLSGDVEPPVPDPVLASFCVEEEPPLPPLPGDSELELASPHAVAARRIDAHTAAFEIRIRSD
jgi:hypothetical protein